MMNSLPASRSVAAPNHLGVVMLSRIAAVTGAIFLALTGTALAVDDSFFYAGKAQAALEKIFDQANHPTKVLSLDIRSDTLTVEVQDPASPKHVDAWVDYLNTSTLLHWIRPESISGPRPVDPTLPNPDLEANLFPLKPADLAVVTTMIMAAIKRAALEDPAGVERMTLRRQLHLLPQPSNGPPEWNIEVSSGRERATIYADIAGHLTHANLDGTRRAQRLNYLAGGKELDDVVAQVADTLGTQPIIRKLIVYNHYLSFEALNPEHPDRFSRFTAGLNGIYRDADDTIANIAIPQQSPPGRFGITDIDWSLLPKLETAARERLRLPGGQIGIVQLSKPANAVGGPVIEWEINVKAANDQVVEGYVVFDGKGNVLRTKFPPGMGPKLDMLDASSAAPAFAAVSSSLGDHAAVVELAFRPENVMVTAKDPQKPDARVVFEYRGESVSRSIMPPLDWPTFGADWFFDLSLAQPIARRWAELQQDTLSRLGLTDGKVERITISKQKLAMPRNDQVLVEIRASAGRREGRVVYDMTGKMVDIVKP
jgi:hypothetical protein